jgi:hypothetical protein
VIGEFWLDPELGEPLEARQVSIPPQGISPSTRTRLRTRDESLLGAEGRVLPVLLALWAYAAVSGGFAIAVGRMMARITQPFLPALPVQQGSVVAIVVAAGVVAEPVLLRLRASVSRHRS